MGIEPGYRVLDYGCGPGGFSVAAARLAGRSGKVYALDIHPVAIRAVQKTASKQGLTSIQTIHSSCATGLEAETIDVILLLDTFHALDDPDGVLRELHRVLKPGGCMAFSDHHLQEDAIRSGVTQKGLFSLTNKGERLYRFGKE